MGERRRLPALALVALLLVAAATAADGPSRPPDSPLSAEAQTPEPARLEASGESDLSPAAQLGKGVTSLAFPGSPLATEPRDPRDPPPGGDPGSESGSVSADPLRGGPPGAVPDVPSQSSESEEGAERERDSEEALEERGI